MAETSKPKKLKQKIIREQFLIEIIFKIISELWDNYFKKYYYHKEKMKRHVKELKKAGNFKFKKTLKQKNEAIFQELQTVCKYAHILLTLIVRGNKKSLQIINELDLVDLLLEQIRTPWYLCLTDLFEIVNEETDMKVLQKEGIKKLLDQLYKDVKRNIHSHKILDLLTNICTPGGKADKKIQDSILEMVIGRDKLPDQYKNIKIESK
jgi:hypothetical protein